MFIYLTVHLVVWSLSGVKLNSCYLRLDAAAPSEYSPDVYQGSR